MGNVGKTLTNIRRIVFAALVACELVLPCAALAQVVTGSLPTAAAHLPREEHWRRSMAKSRPPSKGCLTASYPDTEWHHAQCIEAPRRPPARPPSLALLAVGDTNGDYSAQVPSGRTISQSEGAFLSVSGLTSESDSGVANEFSLQLNSNRFSTPACQGSTTGETNGVSNCQGWAQFTYTNPFQALSGPAPYGGVFIQYWLINYGQSCPSGWSNNSGLTVPDCYYNSPVTQVPLQKIAALGSFTLTGTPGSAGNDSVVFSIGGALYSASNPTSNPNIFLSGNWSVAEFNVVGDGGYTNALFNTGTTLVVKTSVSSGSASVPTCTNGSTTGETNSLTRTPPCCTLAGSSDGAPPGIVFQESNATPLPITSCSALTHSLAWLPGVLRRLSR
jgi:hypothetical protein